MEKNANGGDVMFDHVGSFPCSTCHETAVYVSVCGSPGRLSRRGLPNLVHEARMYLCYIKFCIYYVYSFQLDGDCQITAMPGAPPALAPAHSPRKLVLKLLTLPCAHPYACSACGGRI